MPNHVTTRCTITGPEADIAAIQADLFSDSEKLFDFAQIIPVPEAIEGTEEGTIAQDGARLILLAHNNPYSIDHGFAPMHWERIRKEAGIASPSVAAVAAAALANNPAYEEQGRRRLRAILETGYASWYDWNIAKWGTKWGAYSVEIIDAEPGQFTFKFDTAWSFPAPIFEALVERYPALTFDCRCFDEGWNFAGSGQLGAVVSVPFTIGDATSEIYEAVYGAPPPADDE